MTETQVCSVLYLKVASCVRFTILHALARKPGVRPHIPGQIWCGIKHRCTRLETKTAIARHNHRAQSGKKCMPTTHQRHVPPSRLQSPGTCSRCTHQPSTCLGSTPSAPPRGARWLSLSPGWQGQCIGWEGMGMEVDCAMCATCKPPCSACWHAYSSLHVG